MITIEISDESILFLIYFLVFSGIIGWFIVQCDMNRYRKKLRKERDQ